MRLEETTGSAETAEITEEDIPKNVPCRECAHNLSPDEKYPKCRYISENPKSQDDTCFWGDRKTISVVFVLVVAMKELLDQKYGFQ